MNSLSCFQMPGPAVVSQDFPDETIIIHLETGNYYSLNPPAAALWRLLGSGCPLESLLAGSPQMESAIRAAFETMRAGGLIVPGAAGAGPAERVACSVLEGEPLITAYTDMADLFQLDPVHDVDEAGWPSTLPSSTAQQP